MRKLRLDVEALDVQSFDTQAGGVVANDSTEPTPCGACDTENTGEEFCVGTYFTNCACATNEYTCGCQSNGFSYCGQPTCDRTCGPERTCAQTRCCSGWPVTCGSL